MYKLLVFITQTKTDIIVKYISELSHSKAFVYPFPIKSMEPYGFDTHDTASSDQLPDVQVLCSIMLFYSTL